MPRALYPSAGCLWGSYGCPVGHAALTLAGFSDVLPHLWLCPPRVLLHGDGSGPKQPFRYNTVWVGPPPFLPAYGESSARAQVPLEGLMVPPWIFPPNPETPSTELWPWGHCCCVVAHHGV